MASAELRIQDAIQGRRPGEAMSALMTLYESTPEHKRDAFAAVLIARVALAGQSAPNLVRVA